jgi:ATP-dependent helicase/nuclease subunit B
VLPLFDSQPPPNLTDLALNALAEGVVVITANARAARTLKLRHAERQRANGLTMWASPAIFDWDAWLHHLWQEHAFSSPDASLLLTPLQERILWARVQENEARLVVSPGELAALAQSAYQRLSEYDRHQERKTTWFEPDAENFRRWAKAFDQLCCENAWISRSNLEALLCPAIQAGTVTLPKHILLVGFDRFTPAQQNLFQCLRESQVRTEIALPKPITEISPTLLGADDARDELLTCAEWCRHELEKNPDIRIGIIAPDIHRIRAEADRVFRAILMPQSLDLASSSAPMPFEFSLGVSLSTVPVVRAALLLLRWITTQLREEEISWMLLSDFLNVHNSEALELAQLDFRKRDVNALSKEISLRAFVDRYPSSSFAIRMRKVLKATGNQTQHGDGSYADWSELVLNLLSLAEWPGYRPADSLQFQAQQRWLRLLDEISLLDFAGRKITFAVFLQTLETEAGETIFTAESHHAPIQLLGALESSAQAFDQVWFLGMDDAHWPQTGRPHPLLPIALQRAAKMPHCDAATDTELARTVTRRIAESARNCIFSYARQNKEGELRPSPILKTVFAEGLNRVDAVEFRQQIHAPESTAANPCIESAVIPSQIVPWPIDRVAGGADVLKDQAACPFRAFATRRLATQPLNRTEWGLDAAQRGNLLHTILENIWSPEAPETFRIVTADDLRSVISANRLDQLLLYHIGNAFQRLVEEHQEDSWARAYLESEQQRLLVRLRDWMLYEAKRQPFIVDKREERLKDVHVGGLQLNLRADRIDKLPDGSHLLIDYKTGEVSPSAWKGDRPDEPQLPLYAVYGNVERVSGLLFAQIRAGKIGFVGRATDAKQTVLADLTGSNSLVNQQYDDNMHNGWQRALLQLAEEFLHGEASVDPKRGADTCAYCPLPGLCRVAEAVLAHEAAETEVEDA